MRLVLKFIAVLFLSTVVLSANAATTQARLILSAETARPGDTVMAGIHLKMAPGWHTYWRNPGGPGIATSIAWQLPPGVSAGEIQWPLPERITVSNETSYAFNNEVVLTVPLKLALDLKADSLELKAKVSWLECKIACILGSTNVAAKLTIGSESKRSPEAGLIETWQKRVPLIAPADSVKVSWEKAVTGDSRHLLIDLSNATAGKQTDFIPYAAKDFEILPATEIVSAEPGKVRLRKVVNKSEGDWPKQIAGVVTMGEGEAALAYEVKTPVGESSDAGSVVATQTQSLWRMLLYAFIGGLILNIMPCVLPVIALKILGFVGQAKDTPGSVRKLGLLYAAGVLASFLALAALVIGVKAAGRQAGWGMQFSNPQFVIIFTILVTLVALNLFGVFEITLSGRVMGAAGNLASKHGAPGAFFNGVLATVLATPCTAPFLSLALGFAFAQSAPIIVLVFLTVGAGLALPYVVLSCYPAWLKFLPEPGAWMEKFKIGMGFPMLATAVWLSKVGPEYYGERAWWLGVFLVLLAVAAWIFGEFVQRGRTHKPLAIAVVLVCLTIAYAWALESKLDWRSPIKPSSEANAPLKYAPKGYAWERWSPAAVQGARAAGHVIVVDFTAWWCGTCNVTVKPALSSPEVVAKLKELNAVALLADNSDTPPEVVSELARYGRAGVPMLLVYPTGHDAIVVPDPLSPFPGQYVPVILEALNKATK